MGIGKNLKAILKSKNMTIEELSKKSNISKNTLYAITKRDSFNVRKETLEKISNALDISYLELLYDKRADDIIISLNKSLDNQYITKEQIEPIFEEISKFSKEIQEIGNISINSTMEFDYYMKLSEKLRDIGNLTKVLIKKAKHNYKFSDDIEIDFLETRLLLIDYIIEEKKNGYYAIETPDNKKYGYFSKKDLIELDRRLIDYEKYQVESLLKNAKQLENEKLKNELMKIAEKEDMKKSVNQDSEQANRISWFEEMEKEREKSNEENK